MFLEKNYVTDPTELTTCVHLPGVNNINQISVELGKYIHNKYQYGNNRLKDGQWTHFGHCVTPA